MRRGMTNIEYAVMMATVFAAFLLAFVLFSHEVTEMWDSIGEHAGTRAPSPAGDEP